MKTIVYKNGSHKEVEDNSAWEFESDADWLTTIQVSTPPSLPGSIEEASTSAKNAQVQTYTWIKATDRIWEYGTEVIVKAHGDIFTTKHHNVLESYGQDNVEWLELYTPVHTGKEEGRLREALINLNKSIDDYWNSYDRPDSLVKKVNKRQQEAAKVLASSSVSEGEQGDQDTLWDDFFDNIIWSERESNSEVNQIMKSLQRKYHITKK